MSHDSTSENADNNASFKHFNLVTAVAVLGTVVILALVFTTSGQGHVWPAENSLKVPLTNTK